MEGTKAHPAGESIFRLSTYYTHAGFNSRKVYKKVESVMQASTKMIYISSTLNQRTLLDEY